MSNARKGKSTRSQADLFELMIARELCAELAVEFHYNKELSDTRTLLLETHPTDAVVRVNTQYARTEGAAPVILDLVARRTKTLGPVTEVLWVGHVTGGLEVGVEDIVVVHTKGQTRVSLKSTRNGVGTARNLGGSSIRDLTGALSSELNEYMYEQVLEHVRLVDPSRFEVLAKVKASARRHLMTDPERDIAALVGRDVAGLVRDDIVRSLSGSSALDEAKRRAFARIVLASDDTPYANLFVVVSNDHGVTVSRADEINDEPVVVVALSDAAIGLSQGGERIARLNINCTNGLGLSPICVRSFVN